MQQPQGKGVQDFNAKGVKNPQQSQRNVKQQSPFVGAFNPNTRAGKGNKQGGGKGASAEPWNQSQEQANFWQSNQGQQQQSKKIRGAKKTQESTMGVQNPTGRQQQQGKGKGKGKGKGSSQNVGKAQSGQWGNWYSDQNQAFQSQFAPQQQGKQKAKNPNQSSYILQQSHPVQQPKSQGKGSKWNQSQDMTYQSQFAQQQAPWTSKGKGKNWNANQSYNIQQSQQQPQVKGKGKNWNLNQSYMQQSQQGKQQVKGKGKSWNNQSYNLQQDQLGQQQTKGKGKNRNQNQSYGVSGKGQFAQQQAKGKGKNRNLNISQQPKGKGKGDSLQQSQPSQQKGKKGKGKGSQQPQNQDLSVSQAQKGKKKKLQPQQGAKGSGLQQSRAAKSKNKAFKEGTDKWQPKGTDTFAPNPRARMSSLLTTLPLVDANDLLADYNARAENFPSGDDITGPTEVIFMEPPNISKKKRQGLIIAFHGVEPTKGTMREWSLIPELADWFKMGITLALPNIEMHSAVHKTDIEKYISNTMKSQKVNTCILLGKAWGANVVIQYALDHPNQVKGLILLAPSGPPRINTNKLKMPALVCWAEGDPVIPFEEASEFVDEMRNRTAPTTFKMSDEATHNFAEVMRGDSDIADVMKHFVASALIMAQPDKFEVVKRLSKNLPEKMRSNDPEDMRKLATEDLPNWCRAGMVMAQE